MKLTIIKHFLNTAFITSALLLTLTACDTGPFKPYTQDTQSKDSIASTDVYDDPYLEAERLIYLAKNSSSISNQLKYRTRAARKYIQANEIASAKEQLKLLRANKLQPSPQAQTNEQKIDTFLLTANIALIENNTLLAGQILQKINTITPEQEYYSLSLTADYNFQSSQYMEAVEQRVQLHNSLDSKTEKENNNKKIWEALSSIDNTRLSHLTAKNQTVEGWIELSHVMRARQQSSSLLENNLLNWGTKYPTHPANDSFIRELASTYEDSFTGQRHIAVFLPMQGKFARISATIKNGILSASYEDKQSSPKSTVRFYDTSFYNNSSSNNDNSPNSRSSNSGASNGDLSDSSHSNDNEGINKATGFQELYQQAINNGATNIIGPLDKAVINQLVQQSSYEIPVLTLNYSEDLHANANNLFQYGLSPEDEARQVAELAVKQNKMRAAVFFPESSWGDRLRDAFSEHYHFLGGRVLASQNYPTNTYDYRAPIKQLLNLDQSAIRRKKVENTINKNVKGDPYRRHDIDMIFLAATHRSARGIMPAFKFHHAGDVPVYSTSAAYTGKENVERDRDLNGLIFCDLPWVLKNTSPLESVFKENWPKQINYTRLFALGVDAYHLVHNLNHLGNENHGAYEGQTGKIKLDNNNRVTRELLWAKFRKGKPVYFQPVISSPLLNTDPEL